MLRDARARVRGIGDRWNPADFRTAVDRRAREGTSDRSWREVLTNMRGAFPTLAASALGRVPTPHEPGKALQQPPTPHSSPGYSEWYFTNATSEELAAGLSGASLHLGTPTVAALLGADATLVDASPWTAERFGPMSDWVQDDVANFSSETTFDSACLDPPWYGSNITDWLAMASSYVVVGGLIQFPLLGELTRPSARRERRQILRAAQVIGETQVYSDSVAYEMPTFERQALAVSGLDIDFEWRFADLVTVRNESPAKRPHLAHLKMEWFDVRVGDHLVSVRTDILEHASHPSVNNATYEALGVMDSVSRRNPQLASAHAWSCENRIVRTDNPRWLIDALAELADLKPADKRYDRGRTSSLYMDLFGEEH